MSEDRLEKALDAMKQDDASAADFDAARARVWQQLQSAPAMACAALQSELSDYLAGALEEPRRVLLEDHLSRCAECRNVLAELKGEVKVIAMPAGRPALVRRWQSWAIAAGVAALMLYAGRERLDTLLAPGGPRATVEMASGSLYALPETPLQAGASIMEGDTVRTGAGARAVLRLADGSRVEVNERSELLVSAAWSGQTIRLQRGDVIVQAAKQRRGQLRVATRDTVASVKGTIFAVSTGLSGSLVSVVEGSVAVTQPGSERLLKPGEQAASNPALGGASVGQAVAWSANQEQYLGLLSGLAKIEKQLAALPSPALRRQARLLSSLPANTMVYVAVPNLSGTLGQALALAEQQASENPTFQQWWGSEAGGKAKQMLNHMQTVLPMLGEEVVFAWTADSTQKVPLVLAEVKDGQQSGLSEALAALPMAQHRISGNLLTVSDTAAHLERAVKGTGDGFTAEIARRYQRGVGWMIAMNMAAMHTTALNSAAAQGHTQHAQLALRPGEQMKYVFFEQRTVDGVDENEATLTFDGARTGMSSWLAQSGSNGAAEYFSSDAVVVISAATRSPQQLYNDLWSRILQAKPDAAEHRKELEAKLGISIENDLLGALGTDYAVGIETPTLPVPGWLAAVEVTKPGTLDGTIAKLVSAFNANLPADKQALRLTLGQETSNGRLWTSIKAAGAGKQVYYSYDRGYLVASNDLGVATRAIQTRNGGSPLVHSATFERLIPASAGTNPTGFFWLNAKGALNGLSALASNPALQKLAADRDPVLVIASGETEQIRLSSRTRITSLVLDLMMASPAPSSGQSKGPGAARRGAI